MYVIRMIPCFLQFLNRLSQDYADVVLSECNDENLTAAKEASDFIFNNLHNPVARVEGVGGFVSLTEPGGKKAGGGLLKSMGKMAGEIILLVATLDAVITFCTY